MKRILFAAVIFLAGIWIGHAQTTTAPPWQVGVPNALTHTSCAVTTGVTQMCLASDGLWISVSGGAYAQVQTGVVVAGVTSWNGLTGAVTYTPPATPPAPVTSVNGKTGAVVLSLQ